MLRADFNPFFFGAAGAFFGGLLGWFGSWGLGSSWQRCVDKQMATQQVEREHLWGEIRHTEMIATERDSQALLKARAQVLDIAAKNPGHKMPTNAAVCFTAREIIDDDLREAMGPGREFGDALNTWHVERRAVNQFCAYAMTIGAKK